MHLACLARVRKEKSKCMLVLSLAQQCSQVRCLWLTKEHFNTLVAPP